MKSIFIGSLAVLFFQMHAQTFLPKADFPQPLERSFSFMLHGKIYVGTGRNELGQMNNHVWRYDPATDKWTQLNDFPTLPFRNGIAMVVNDTAYAGKGYDGGLNDLNVWLQYDEATDSWLPQKKGMDNVGEYSGIFTLDGKGYAVAGSGALGEHHEVWMYDPAADAWTQKADFPGAARDFPFAVTADGKAFVGLGDFFIAPPFYSDAYKYDPTTDSWSVIAPIPVSSTGVVAEGGCSFHAVYDGKIILMSLFDLSSAEITDFLTVYVYEIATDTWTLYEQANDAGPRITPIFAQNGSKAYVGAGLTFNGVAADFYEVDLGAFVSALEEANPSFSAIKVWAAEGVLSASIPTELFQKFSETGLSLDLFSMDGRLLNRFSLAETNRFDLSDLPTAGYSWVVRAGDRALKSGKIVR